MTGTSVVIVAARQRQVAWFSLPLLYTNTSTLGRLLCPIYQPQHHLWLQIYSLVSSDMYQDSNLTDITLKLICPRSIKFYCWRSRTLDR